MANLFVANTSRQHAIFTFRLPERDRVYRYEIPSGQQVMLGDFDSGTINAIVSQHFLYGMVEHSDVGNNGITLRGLCYRVGAPVDATTIEAGCHSGRQHEKALSERAMENGAVSVSAFVETQTRNQDPANLRTSEPEVTVGHMTDAAGGRQIDDGFKIERRVA